MENGDGFPGFCRFVVDRAAVNRSDHGNRLPRFATEPPLDVAVAVAVAVAAYGSIFYVETARSNRY